MENEIQNLSGKIFNLRDLEQGLDNINRLPSRDATMEIIPKEEAGLSDVLVNVDKKKCWNGSLSFGNTGGTSTGVPIFWSRPLVSC